MYEKDRCRCDCNPSLDETPQQKEQQRGIRDVKKHIYDVVAGWVQAPRQMVEIEGEECQLPQVKGIEKVGPLRGVHNIRVIGNQDVVEMKRIVKRRSEK